MISRIRQYLFSVQFAYIDPLEQQRAQGLLILSALLLLFWAAAGAFTLPALMNGEIQLTVELAASLAAPPVLLVVHYMVQSGRARPAAWFFVLSQAAVILITQTSIYTPIMAVPVVMAGLLLGLRGLSIVGLLLAARFAGELLREGGLTPQLSAAALGLVLIGIMIFLLSTALVSIAVRIGQNMRRLQEIIDHGVLLPASKTENPETALLHSLLELLRDGLRYEFSQVYLFDQQGDPVRRLYTGAGSERIRSSSTMNIGDANIVVEAHRTGRLMQASTTDPIPRRSHFMPSLQFGAAVPISDGGGIFAVLDVQTSTPGGLTNEDLDTLQVLVRLIAREQYYTRQVASMQDDMRQQRELIRQLSDSLQRAQGMERSRITGDWAAYLRQRGMEAIGFDIDPQDGELRLSNTLPQPLRSALSSGEITIEKEGDTRLLNIPILLRGEVLGGIALTLPAGQVVSDQQLDMVRKIIDRLGTALENKRLFEQTQALAQRETKASAAASLLLSSTDVTTVLEMAAQSFNRTLDAIHTQVYLRPGAFAQEPEPQKEEQGS